MVAGTPPAMGADARAFNWIIGVTDKASKPMKTIGATWTKVAASAAKESQRFKSGVTGVGGELKRMAKDLQSTGRQLKSFGGAIKNVLAMFGIGVAVVGLIGGLKTAIKWAFEFKLAIDDLIPAVDVASGAMASLSEDVRHFAVTTGESYENTVKWLGALAEIRPYSRDFRNFADSVLIYADATGQSRESTAELFVNIEKLTGSKPFELRKLGNAMKYWADTSSMTNSEVMQLAGSFNDFLLLTPGKKDPMLVSRLVGLGAALKDVGGNAGDVAGILGELRKEEGDLTFAQRGFLGRRGGMGFSEVSKAFAAKKPEQVFRALVTAAKDYANDPNVKNLLATAPQQVEDMTGFPATLIAQLAKIPMDKLTDKALQAAEASENAHKSWLKRQASVERRWNRIVMRFKDMISRVAAPLADLMEKQLKPIEKILEVITDAAGKAITALTSTSTPGETIFSKLADAAKVFWETLSSNSQMQEFYKKFQQTIVDSKDWLATNFFAPLLESTWNQTVGAQWSFLKIDPGKRNRANEMKRLETLALTGAFGTGAQQNIFGALFASGSISGYQTSILDAIQQAKVGPGRFGVEQGMYSNRDVAKKALAAIKEAYILEATRGRSDIRYDVLMESLKKQGIGVVPAIIDTEAERAQIFQLLHEIDMLSPNWGIHGGGS